MENHIWSVSWVQKHTNICFDDLVFVLFNVYVYFFELIFVLMNDSTK